MEKIRKWYDMKVLEKILFNHENIKIYNIFKQKLSKISNEIAEGNQFQSISQWYEKVQKSFS